MLMARLVPACRNSNNKTPGYFLPFSTPSQRKTSMQTIDRSELSNLPAYAAPVTELEGQICSAFSLGTGVSPIGLDDDIFDLGNIGAKEVTKTVTQLPLSHVFNAKHEQSRVRACRKSATRRIKCMIVRVYAKTTPRHTIKPLIVV